MELIRIYCAETDDTPTAYGFLEWQSTLKNPIFSLVSELTLNIGLRIYINRVGEQNNNYRCSQAGRMKCNDMFHEFNHLIYTEVKYSDLCKSRI